MTQPTSKDKRVIPLTAPGPQWSQREYVACTELHIGFAAHRHGSLGQAFHYAFPGDIGCTTVLIGAGGAVERYIDHPFKRQHNWIEMARAATQALLNNR